MFVLVFFFFFKQKTAYEMRISDWSSDVCSSDLNGAFSLDEDRYVVDTTGSRLQVLPVDAAGSITGTSASDLTDLVVPTESGGLDANGNPIPLSGLDISQTGLVTATRSEEHTSELQSLMRISYAVFCLKKTTTYTQQH